MKNRSSCRWAPAGKFFLGLGLFLTNTGLVKSQTAVTSVTTSYSTVNTGIAYTDNGAPNSVVTANTYTYKYGNLSGTTNNILHLNTFMVGSETFVPTVLPGSVVKVRRVDNAQVTGIRFIKFEEGNIDSLNNITITGAYNDDMENFLNGYNGFNAGSDNLFANLSDGNGNHNNIERVDFLLPGATRASDNTKVGFSVFERGNAGQHDPLKVALVLSVDATGKPAGYSNILSITAANYGDVLPAKNYIIQRRDVASEPHLKYSLITNQVIGGVFFRYSDFGIANNAAVYGYSLFCNDFAGTPAQAVDYTNPGFFPTNSSTGAGYGGIDLVAVSGLSSSAAVLLPVKLTSFTTRQQGNQLAIQWIMAEQGEINQYEIEYSRDGINFTVVQQVPANHHQATYHTSLPLPPGGTGYYRLRMTDQEGKTTYSNTNKVVVGKAAEITLYPNPAKDKVSISFTENMQDGPVTISIRSAAGMVVWEERKQVISQSETINVSRLAAGKYTMQLMTGNEVINKSLVIVK